MADVFLFIDTEFTSFKNPELISICLAKDEKDFIYLEAPYNTQNCSDFVKTDVLPLLSGPTLSLQEVRNQIALYIQKHIESGPIYIIGDYAGDWNIFLDLMKPLGGKKELGIDGYINLYSYLGYAIHKNVLHDEIARNCMSNIDIIYEASQKSWFKKYDKFEHHAKSDALANRYAFNQCMSYIKSVSTKV